MQLKYKAGCVIDYQEDFYISEGHKIIYSEFYKFINFVTNLKHFKLFVKLNKSTCSNSIIYISKCFAISLLSGYIYPYLIVYGGLTTSGLLLFVIMVLL